MSVRLAKVLGVRVAYPYCDGDELANMLLAFHRATKPARHLAMALLSDAMAG